MYQVHTQPWSCANHLRRLNLERVLTAAIDHDGEFTRAELIKATGLSAPTVGSLASALIRVGLLSELGAGPSRGGRVRRASHVGVFEGDQVDPVIEGRGARYTVDELRRQVEALGPWFHDIDLGEGVRTAPNHPLGNFLEEIWAHVLAYNLIRTVMARAAAGEGAPPRPIGVKATLQVLEAFRPLVERQAHRGEAHRAALCQQILRAIAVHRVADRPDRFEPRMAKQGPRRHNRLTRPRREIKLQMLKRVSKI